MLLLLGVRISASANIAEPQYACLKTSQNSSLNAFNGVVPAIRCYTSTKVTMNLHVL